MDCSLLGCPKMPSKRAVWPGAAWCMARVMHLNEGDENTSALLPDDERGHVLQPLPDHIHPATKTQTFKTFTSGGLADHSASSGPVWRLPTSLTLSLAPPPLLHVLTFLPLSLSPSRLRRQLWGRLHRFEAHLSTAITRSPTPMRPEAAAGPPSSKYSTPRSSSESPMPIPPRFVIALVRFSSLYDRPLNLQDRPSDRSVASQASPSRRF